MVHSTTCSSVLAASLATAFMSAPLAAQPPTPLDPVETTTLSDACFVPRLETGHEIYTVADIAKAVRLSRRVVQHHCERLFPNWSGWYRFDFEQAQRVVNYIQKVRYEQRQRQTVDLLKATLPKKNLSSGV